MPQHNRTKWKQLRHLLIASTMMMGVYSLPANADVGHPPVVINDLVDVNILQAKQPLGALRKAANASAPNFKAPLNWYPRKWTVYAPLSVGRVTLQLKSGKTWRNVTTKRLKQESVDYSLGKVSFNITAPAKRVGKYAYRAVSEETGHVIRKRVFRSTRVTGITLHHSGYKGTVHAAVGEKRKLNIYVFSPLIPKAKERFTVQRHDGNQWRKVGRVSAKRIVADRKFQSYLYAVPLPAPRKAGTAKYRVILPKSAKATKARSQTFKVEVIDQKKHKQYILAARKAMKKHCANQKIYIDAKELKRTGAAGLAYPYNVEYYSVISSGLSSDWLKYVARHECAHAVQQRNYHFYGNWGKYSKKANKIYKSTRGIELAADCMVAYWTGTAKHNHYTKDCSGKRMTFAKKTFKGTALSKRYNPPKR